MLYLFLKMLYLLVGPFLLFFFLVVKLSLRKFLGYLKPNHMTVIIDCFDQIEQNFLGTKLLGHNQPVVNALIVRHGILAMKHMQLRVSLHTVRVSMVLEYMPPSLVKIVSHI